MTLTVLATYLTSLGLPVVVARHGAGGTPLARGVMRWSLVATSIASLAGAVAVVMVRTTGLVQPLMVHGWLVGGLLCFVAVNGLSVYTLLDLRDLAANDHRAVLARAVAVAGLRLLIVVAPLPHDPFWLWLWIAAATPVAVVLALPFSGRRARTAPGTHEPATVGLLVRSAGANYAGLLLSQAPLIAFPVVVAARVDAAERAVFFVAWSIVSAAFLVPTIAGRALLVEGDRNDSRLREQAWFTVRTTTAVGVVLLVGAALLGTAIPALYGSDYADARLVLVVLMAAIVPYGVTSTALTFTRIRVRHGPNVAISAVLAVAVLGPATVLSPTGGVVPLGVGWLVGHFVAAIVALWGIAAERTGGGVATRAAPVGARTTAGATLAVAVGTLMAGPAGAVAALSAVACHVVGAAVVPAAAGAVLMAVAALATLFESSLTAGLLFAEHRPLAGAAGSLAIVLVTASALLRLADHVPSGARTQPRSRPTASERAPAARVLGALPVLSLSVLAAGLAAVVAPDPLDLDQRRALGPVVAGGLGRLADGHDVVAAPLGFLAAVHGPVSPAAAQLGAYVGAVVLLASATPLLRRFRYLVAPLACLPALLTTASMSSVLALALGLAAVRLVQYERSGTAGALAAVAALAATEAVPAFAMYLLVAHEGLGRAHRRSIARAALGSAVVLLPWLRWLWARDALDTITIPDPIVLAGLAVPLVAAARWGTPPRPATSPSSPRSRLARARPLLRREHAVLALLALVAVAASFAGGAGRYVAEFRFEAAWGPGGALERLPSIWHETGGLGRVAGAEVNPFALGAYGLARGLGLGPGVAQHLWHALLLFGAGSGVVVLVRAFLPRVGSPHLFAALAYMVSPLTLSLLTNSPIYLAAMVVAPWLHASLLHGAVLGGWRWPAVFALALWAALPTELPSTIYNVAFLAPTVLFLVVLRLAPLRDLVGCLARTAVLVAATTGFVVVRSLYGSADLVSRVALSETPQLVNAVSSYSETVRGLGGWLTYLRLGALTSRPHHAALVESPFVVAATFVVPVVACLVLAWRRSSPVVAYFALLAGLSSMVVVGLYPPDDPSPWGRLVLGIYERVPAAAGMRNTAKAAAPLALGYAVLFGLAVGLVVDEVRRRRRSPVPPCVLAAGVLVLASLPVWTGDLHDDELSIAGLPVYWEDAFAWLDDPDRDEGRAFVLPGSYATAYRWGHVGDDIFTGQLRRAHVRSSPFPQSAPESDNLVSAVDVAATEGWVDPSALADVLGRIGVRYVVVRNDLDWQSLDRPRPIDFERLRASDRFRLAAVFGEPGENTADPDDRSPAAAAERLLHPVEIFELHGVPPSRRVVTGPPLLVAGDGEGWFSLAARGLLSTGAPIRYVAAMTDAALVSALEGGAPVVITDSNVRRERVATRGGTRRSPALSSRTEVEANGALFDDADEQTVSTNAAGASLRASTSRIEAPWFRVEQAFDRDLATSWRTPAWRDPRGAWIEVDLPRPTAVSTLRVTRVARSGGGRVVRAARVSTSDGQARDLVFVGDVATVELDGSPVERVRIDISAVTGDGQHGVGFSEVEFVGVDLVEHRRTPVRLFERARRSTELARALRSADIAYVFRRDVGDGPEPVEPVLRRRFHVAERTAFRVAGTISGDASRGASLATGACDPRLLRIDGRPVPVVLTRQMGSTRAYDFESCAPVTLAGGQHELSHDPVIAVDDLALTSVGFELPSARIEPAADVPLTQPLTTRRLRVDATGSTGGASSYVISGSAYHPGWEASSAGRPLDVVSVDTQAAVVLDRHDVQAVELRFEPQEAFGPALTLMTAGLVLCLWLALPRTGRARGSALPREEHELVPDAEA